MTWVRIRDWHILTSGLLTYTADARFRVKHATDAFEWTLEIKYLQKRDEGTYYCQVSYLHEHKGAFSQSSRIPHNA